MSQKRFKMDRWSGTYLALVLLIVVVIGMAMLAVIFPLDPTLGTAPSNTTPQPTPLPTALPVNTEGEAMVIDPVIIPPAVDTTWLVIIGGLLVIIVLVGILREISYQRSQEH